MLLEGALTIDTKFERPAVSALKGVGINLAVFPSEALHNLQDGMIVELWACEQCALHVTSE